MFGYRSTNQAAAAATSPATNRRASRAVRTWIAISPSGTATISAMISGTSPLIVSSGSASGRQARDGQRDAARRPP